MRGREAALQQATPHPQILNNFNKNDFHRLHVPWGRMSSHSCAGLGMASQFKTGPGSSLQDTGPSLPRIWSWQDAWADTSDEGLWASTRACDSDRLSARPFQRRREGYVEAVRGGLGQDGNGLESSERNGALLRRPHTNAFVLGRVQRWHVDERRPVPLTSSLLSAGPPVGCAGGWAPQWLIGDRVVSA
eukprot:CAMPEP_0174370886 /NCGR_PEP_ID=MMETSP0811_2-20130205/97712_1 /TAXON_ID=73025 ORGANISM="Eutreptiella gymnastica-like, Strain CCMP1594" /NCGR_SAMPLE_ID=MMETSP0811_2 /ASSEMBLY_ACC=CAM_ASM_000667 /LENGTH=188 /DNA_ID=CAMNT_0015516751 /DNA_START=38 /DNA_END=603 /DNA_ORIENTATION=+